jgi:hypothetical protein
VEDARHDDAERPAIELGWTRSTPDDSEGRIALVVAALPGLEAALELTRFEVGLDRVDSDETPPRSFWTLVRRGVYPDEAEMEADPQHDEPCRVVDRLDRASVEALLREAAAGRQPDVLVDMVAVEARRPGTPGVGVRIQFWFLIDASVEIESPATGGPSAAIDAALAALLAAGWQRETPEEEVADAAAVAPPVPRSSTEGADGYTLDEPITIELDWPRPEEDPAEQAATALEAVRLFAAAAEPVALFLTTGFAGGRSGDGLRPRRFLWQLEESGAPDERALFGVVTRTVTSLEPETTAAFLRGALTPHRPGGLFGWLRRARPVGWTMLSVGRMRVELPEPDRAGSRDALLLDCPGGPVRPALRRTGPRVLVEPLAGAPDGVGESAVTLMFLSGSLLHVGIHWSPWNVGPGRALVERAVARLVAHGWKPSDS